MRSASAPLRSRWLPAILSHCPAKRETTASSRSTSTSLSSAGLGNRSILPDRKTGAGLRPSSSGGLPFKAEIFDNRGDPGAATSERFDFEFIDTTAGWQYLRIPFAEFTRATDFQPPGAPNDGFTLTEIWGWAIELPIGEDIVYFDDIGLGGDADVDTDIDVKITKTGELVGECGVEWVVTVENLGPSDGTGVVVTDVLPPEVIFVSRVDRRHVRPDNRDLGCRSVGQRSKCVAHDPDRRSQRMRRRWTGQRPSLSDRHERCVGCDDTRRQRPVEQHRRSVGGSLQPGRR